VRRSASAAAQRTAFWELVDVDTPTTIRPEVRPIGWADGSGSVPAGNGETLGALPLPFAIYSGQSRLRDRLGVSQET
jgi:hypothetical protein